jgi:hypothetical protein
MDNNRDFEQDSTPAGPTRPSGSRPPRPRHPIRWVAGLGAAAVLVGGGAALVASSGSASAATGTPAAALSDVLTSANAPSAADLAATGETTTPAAPSGHPCATAAAALRAAGHPRAARRVRAACRGRLQRLRLFIRGEHGQVTFTAKGGTTRTLAFERGRVTAVNGTDVTVQAADGTTWTWHLVSDSVVRESGQKVSTSAVAVGQQVFAGGPVVNGADDARLIVIRPAQAAAAPSPSATPSGS